MSFNNFSEFVSMGGHGLYVWMAYGVAVVIFIINAVTPVIRRKVLFQELAQLQRREAREAEHYEQRQQQAQNSQNIGSNGEVEV